MISGTRLAHPIVNLQDLAEDRLSNGYLGESHELITDALNTMLQVYGPLHADIESSHKLVQNEYMSSQRMSSQYSEVCSQILLRSRY